MLISLNGEGTLQEQIARSLRAAVLAGRLSAGGRLPGSRALARQLGVSRNVVMFAVEQLVSEGYLSARPGSGTYVTGRLPDEATGVRPPRHHAGPPPDGVEPGWSNYARRIGAAPAAETARAALPFDFRYGLAVPDARSIAIWRRIQSRRNRQPQFDYPPPAGLPALRRAIAAQVCPRRGFRPDAEQVIVVAGAQQGLQLCALLLLDPGDPVVIEEPHYQGARQLFAASGARLLRCAVDGHGLDPAGLPDIDGVKLLYVTPSHQFPSGGVLPLPRRLALLEWAVRHGVAVIEDDYDSELSYDARPVESISALDSAGLVIYVGSFAKTLYPALRLGFLVVPRRWAARFAAAKWLADRGVPSFEQQVLADFLDEGHYERHLRRMSRRYAARRTRLVAALHRQFGGRVAIDGGGAGAHVVVWLDDLPAAAVSSLLEAAATRGVGLYPIGPYYLEPPPRTGLLLGYASIDETQIDEGIRRFAEAVAMSIRRAG